VQHYGCGGDSPHAFFLFTRLWQPKPPCPTKSSASGTYAVRYSILRTEQTIKYTQELGLSSAYDELQLEQLRDLEQFLKMSWDVWMDDMGAILLPAEVVK
jgi:hypothetical protein